MKYRKLPLVLAILALSINFTQSTLYASAEIMPSESSIKLFVDPQIVTFGSYVNITGKIFPPLSVTIMISGIAEVVSSYDGSFHYMWMPPGREEFSIVALWKGDQDHFASRSNTQKVKVVGGPGPSWLEVGSYLHYKHNLEVGHLIYTFHGPVPMMWPGPEIPLELSVVEEQWQFYSHSAGRGFIHYVNITSRDTHGLTYLEKQGKTWLWISPEVSVGDSVQIWDDYYTVIGSENISSQGRSREAWILKNPYRTLWYDKKLGILLKGNNLVHERADYPYSIILYETNIKFDSTISLQVKPSETFLGSRINISGYLNPALSTRIQIQWSLDQENWYSLQVATSNGLYFCKWPPPCSGRIYLKASWEGNEFYAGTSSTIESATVFLNEQEMELYNDLLTKYETLNTAYKTLELNYDSLSFNHTFLQRSYDELQTKFASLNVTYSLLKDNYESLLSSYSSLNATYTSLKSEYVSTSRKLEIKTEELKTITSLMYVFMITSIIFIATTIYFARRK